MNFDERLRQMLAEPRAHPRPGHGVPLVADAAGVQPQRPRRRGLGPQRGISGAMKRALKSLAKKPPSAKKRACGSAALPDRPLHRRHRVEIAVRQRGQRADVEVARALVLECRERRVLAKISAAE
jgi:hypothetical protein